jgi:hypothetical protein
MTWQVSVPMDRVGHLGLGPACVVAVGWLRGATSNGEKTSNNIQQNKTATACSSSSSFLPPLTLAVLLFP